MVNRVILIGNLGRDPEVRRLESGAVVAKFPVATNENYKDKSGEWQKLTEWHDVVVWRNLAERAERDLKKGMAVYIEGKLTHRKWQDQDGNNRKTTEVVGSYFRILTRREGEQGGTSNYFPDVEDETAIAGYSKAPSSPSNATESTVAQNGPSTGDDDLPF